MIFQKTQQIGYKQAIGYRSQERADILLHDVIVHYDNEKIRFAAANDLAGYVICECSPSELRIKNLKTSESMFIRLSQGRLYAGGEEIK